MTEQTTNEQPRTIAYQATCVMIGDRGVMIEGTPGAGKSTLALALIDRGATLVGDDGVALEVHGGWVLASPHVNIAGKLEVRNIGLIDVPVVANVPLALVIRLDAAAPRFITAAEKALVAGCDVPLIRLYPDTPALPLRAELALRQFGLRTD